MRNISKRAVCLAIVGLFWTHMLLPGTTARAQEAEPEETLNGAIVLETAQSYREYMAQHAAAARPGETILLEGSGYSGADYTPEILENYAGASGKSLLTQEEGYVEWTVHIDEPGLYNIGITYYPYEGKGATIVRSLYVDGDLPFSEARSISFQRIWRDVREEGADDRGLRQDTSGNDIRPMQEEQPAWISTDMRISSEFSNEAVSLYLTQGSHVLRLSAVQEPLLIKELRLYQQETAPAYAQAKAAFDQASYQPAAGTGVKIQAEKVASKSDSMIVPISDRSSPATEPNHVSKLKLNSIGGSGWNQAGQWITWDLYVPETGLYHIGIKALQNFTSGSDSHRRVMIDGKVPYQELNDVVFPYASGWQMHALGTGEEPYAFYLEKGHHEITMEVTLGDLADILMESNTILTQLNEVYRNILILTGPIPDVNRDYQFDLAIPETIEDMRRLSGELHAIYDRLVDIAGMQGANSQTVFQLFTQMDEMIGNTNKIAERFNAFQSNINAFGAWINDMKLQPLTLDYIVAVPAGTEMPSPGASFWEQAKYAVGSFFASFYEDYNSIASDSEEKAISVWVGSGLTGGRDQAQILKTLASNYFTPQSGVGVNLQLVSAGALLPATLAGKGPDVALSISTAEAANYMFRNAAVDLAKFPDLPQIIQRFQPSAMVPLTYGDIVYGLPETQTFPMLFYRKDILAELGLSIPQTWDDVINMLPVLQKKQMNFGLPNVAGVGMAAGATMTMYLTFLYQNGGELYADDGKSTSIDSDISVNTFSYFTDLYTSYQIPQSIDFINRFRMGSIPIGIADYSAFNQISVFAPELNGLWGFTSVPGTRKEDGTIDRSAPGSCTASIILSQSDRQEEAWEFIKWWTDTQAQVQFGRQLESIMGSAARYPTANKEALYQIPWSKEFYDALMAQWDHVKGIPEAPGGYYVPRYLDFAFRGVVNQSYEVSEELDQAAKAINAEIQQKRKEFGLPV